MGFFSAVKRFFGQKATEPATAKNASDSGSAGNNILPDPATFAARSSETGLAAPSEHEEKEPISQPEAEKEESTAAAKQDANNFHNFEHLETVVDIAPESREKVKENAPSSEAPGDAEALLVAATEGERREQEEDPTASFIETDGGDAQPGEREGSGPIVTSQDNELLLELRSAEPRLSAWLAVVLKNQDQVNEEFWHRLRFLLESLEAPQGEIDLFLDDFARWLEKMEYHHIDEFRSELQYRLAVALDLEDEEDERNRLLVKLQAGLAATRAHIGRQLDGLLSAHEKLDEAFWEEMEELFITADMGYETSVEMVRRLRERAVAAKISEPARVRELLREELEEIFRLKLRIRTANKPEIYLMMGVNGAGKTTTIAKLAYKEKLNGKKVLVVAADTFRAAAMEQLKIWADRVGVSFYQKPAGSDPASVAWEGVDYALAHDIDVVFVDTAGRLQTRVDLMEELGKIRQVLSKKHPGSPHRNILVLDATTGQNALSQAKLFKEAAGADEIILTKLDGTAKGGVAIAVAMREEMPISYIGLGEKLEDLRPFNGADFANALLNESEKAA